MVSESFGYKPASRLAQVGIPTYSLVMAVVTLVHDPAQWPWVFLAVPVGMAIG